MLEDYSCKKIEIKTYLAFKAVFSSTSPGLKTRIIVIGTVIIVIGTAIIVIGTVIIVNKR